MRIVVLLLVLLALVRVAGAEPIRITGTVVDDQGEPVAGATVLSGDHTATTDADGRFTIVGEKDVLIVADGYAPKTVKARRKLAITLSADGGEVIEVTGEAPEETKPTEYKLTAEEIRTTPGAMNDALRAITILPAAARIPYSFGGLVLRGMSPRDTSVFVDGVEIPMAFHFGGITGVFPTSQLADMKVIPSGFDVSRGRTQGGVVELESRRPRRDRHRISGEVSLLHAAVAAEGPTWRNGGYLVGLRRSYFDTLIRPFIDRNDPTPSYLDGQARMVWGTPVKGETTAYLLGSLDRVANSDDAATPNDDEANGHMAANLGFLRLGGEYERRIGKVTWKAAPHVGTNVLSVHTKDYGGGATLDEVKAARRWYQFGARGEWLRDDDHGFVRAGVDLAGGYLGRVSGDVVLDDVADDDAPFPRNTVLWLDAAVWAEVRRHWYGDKVSIRPGVRLDRFGLGNDTAIDVRVNGHVALSEAATLRGSVGRYHQPPSPAHFDEFTDNLDADSSYVDQVTLGVEWTGRSDDAEVGAGAVAFWHEGRDTLVDASMEEGASAPDMLALVFKELLEEQLGFYGNQANAGAQRTYGVELSARYQRGDVRALANYTWSRSKRQYLMPDDAWVPYGLDQPIRFNAVIATTWGKWNLGARLTAVSGNPVRLFPEGTPIDEAHQDPDTAPLMRLPTFWQLDVRADRSWKKPYGTVSLFFDILNATHHRNVEMRSNQPSWDPDPEAPQTWTYSDTRGLPIIPTIGVELIPYD